MFAGCDAFFHRPLPFPTPAQQNLVVLTTENPLTFSADDTVSANGLERDLVEAFAKSLGVGVDYKIIPADEIADRIASGEGHLAMNWLPQSTDSALQSSPPIMYSHDLLVQHEASLPIQNASELSGKTIFALRGSRQHKNLRKLQETIPKLMVLEVGEGDIFDLLEAVENHKYEYVAIDSTLADIANRLNPSLQTSLKLSDDSPIVWWLSEKPNVELLARLKAFVANAKEDGTMARIQDRYFGHTHRLTQTDIVKFLANTETLLPKLRKDFVAAQQITGIDWRLIAALAYQESKWDPEATSPTGVRGIMMLTEETADRLKVSNRLDPHESILAGARYVNLLKDMQAEEVKEPDRTWLALASYNIGPGHFNAARSIAKQVGADPSTWYDMKRVLPLLAKPKYYEHLKSGRARGGEAVILVENVRNYYDILAYHEANDQPSSKQLPGFEPYKSKPGAMPGLLVKR